MGACLPIEEGACQWDDLAHPINSDGEQGRAELARGCAEIWLAAVKTYYRDAQSAMRGAKTADLEALDDLTGSRRLLEALCEPLGADVQVVGDAMVEVIDAELSKPRAKRKRRGKAEAVTLD